MVPSAGLMRKDFASCPTDLCSSCFLSATVFAGWAFSTQVTVPMYVFALCIHTETRDRLHHSRIRTANMKTPASQKILASLRLSSTINGPYSFYGEDSEQ